MFFLIENSLEVVCDWVFTPILSLNVIYIRIEYNISLSKQKREKIYTYIFTSLCANNKILFV